MPESGESFCYNKGCGAKFSAPDNGAESCKFHPGVPVFHDAYKGWGCCNKKVTDFTEFLNIPGCTLGPHNGEKPSEPERRPIVEQSGGAGEAEESPAPKARAPPTAASRDAADEPRTELPKTVAAVLRDALAAKEAEVAAAAAAPKDEAPAEVAPGTPCHNAACQRTFDAAADPALANCWHHPGTAIFHEGMKYWSCCNKKTSDFDMFLSQPGCTRGEHRWVAEGPKEGAALEAREDFHQTPSHVVLTYYLKRSHPSLTRVTANPVSLAVSLASVDGAGKAETIQLWGAIDVAQSAVNQTPSKVEVKMRKADPVAWAGLRFRPPPASDQQ